MESSVAAWPSPRCSAATRANVANVESGETMTSIEHHERPARINRQLMVIGGRSVESSDGRYIDVENPANRTTIGQVPRATADDIDSAVRGAAAAFEAWRLVVPRDRGRLLSSIADAMEAELETLARTVAQETGNAIRTQARPEVKSAIDVFRYFGGVASELKGETVPLGEHVLSYTRREPIGGSAASCRGTPPWCWARSRLRCRSQRAIRSS